MVGGYNDNSPVGATWVFARSGKTWTQQEPKLLGAGSSDGGLGWSVALPADGNTALAGGINDNNGKGAAWVFVHSGSTWTQQGPKLTANDEINHFPCGCFGSSVALSGNGGTALIGGPLDNDGKGAAWVFVRSGSTWTQQGKKLTEAQKEQFRLERGGLRRWGYGRDRRSRGLVSPTRQI